MSKDLNTTGRWLKRITQSLSGEPQDREELVRACCARPASAACWTPTRSTMLEGVLEVADLQVRDIMVPRVQMVFVRRDEHAGADPAGGDRVRPLALPGDGRGPRQHRRHPARQGPAAPVRGGVARALRHHASTCGPAVFVPESKRLNVLLKEFRRNRNHMALVVDEYGGVSGLVTIEDVIEQIIGEIDDEFDVEDDQNIRRESDRQFAVRGVTRLDEFNEYFGTQLAAEEFDTIAGLRHEAARPPAAPRRGREHRRLRVPRDARRSPAHRRPAGDGTA